MTGLNLTQFRDHIVRPTLERLELYSSSAERLVIGTALTESGLTWLHQIKGPAIGLYQMEPDTHDDIWQRYLAQKPKLVSNVISLLIAGLPEPEQMHGNLYYATAMCRIFYLRFPEPLPEPNDLKGMARLWKQRYNTSAGAGTVEGFMKKAGAVLDL